MISHFFCQIKCRDSLSTVWIKQKFHYPHQAHGQLHLLFHPYPTFQAYAFYDRAVLPSPGQYFHCCSDCVCFFRAESGLSADLYLYCLVQEPLPDAPPYRSIRLLYSLFHTVFFIQRYHTGFLFVYPTQCQYVKKKEIGSNN